MYTYKLLTCMYIYIYIYILDTFHRYMKYVRGPFNKFPDFLYRHLKLS